MSYSFYAKGNTKADARASAIEQLDAIIVQQPIHAKDKDAAVANIDSALSILTADSLPDCDVVLTCSGSISYKYDNEVAPEDSDVIGVNISTSAGYSTKGVM